MQGERSTHAISDGQWLVVTATSGAGKKADLRVFDSEADADQECSFVLGNAAATAVRPTPVKTLSMVTKATATNVCHDVDQIVVAAPPPPSPYDGKVARGMTLPVLARHLGLHHARKQPLEPRAAVRTR